MLREKDYIIEFNKVRLGDNQYEFALTTEFVRSIDEDSTLEADLIAYLNLFKTETMYDLKFQLSGKVRTTCDTCLDEFEMPVKSDFNLLLKLSETEKYDDGEIVYITPQTIDYNVSQYLYECLVLSLPIRKTCGLGGKACNSAVMEKLSNIQIIDNEEEGEKSIDPRWDKLKQIFNN